MTEKMMTQAEYARRRGVSAVAVHKAIKSRRIALIDGMIDPVVADAQWSENTRKRISTLRDDGGAGRVDSREHGDAGSAGIDVDRISYDEARRRREAAEAQIAERKLQELDAVLVRSEDVRASIARRAATFREALMQVPGRISAQLAAESNAARVHEIIDSELRAVVAHLVKS